MSVNITKITPRELKDPKFIPEDDLTKILAYLYNKKDKRHFAFIFFLLNAGCRKSDALALTWSQVDWGNRIIYIKNIKKNRNYVIPLTNMLEESLNLMKGRYPDRVFGFANQTSLEFYWRCQVNLFGCNKYTMHELRKTFITKLLQKGYDLDTVKKLVNHVEVETISRYYNVAVINQYRERLDGIGVISSDLYANIYANLSVEGVKTFDSESERGDLNPRPPEPHSG
jgi:integrase